jgi:hypothetical protein
MTLHCIKLLPNFPYFRHTGRSEQTGADHQDRTLDRRQIGQADQGTGHIHRQAGSGQANAGNIWVGDRKV